MPLSQRVAPRIVLDEQALASVLPPSRNFTNPLVVVTVTDRLGIAIEQSLAMHGLDLQRLIPTGDYARELDTAGLASAEVLVLAADDDACNVDMALTARRLRPTIPLVVRLFDAALANYLEKTLSNIVILSMSAVSAPVFAEMALLAIQQHKRTVPGIQIAASPSKRMVKRLVKIDRVMLGAIVALPSLVIPATFYFSYTLDLRPFNALYFVWTTITTVGYGDVHLLTAPDGAKLLAMFLMFAGAAFIALLYAFFTEWVVTRRLDVLRGRVPVRSKNHVVIVGGGNVGFRVAQLLYERGYAIVVVERNPENRNIAALREAGHHVIIADAISDEILHLANLSLASVVLALTDSDSVNLHIAVRARAQSVPVVMRAESPELSAHVSECSEILSSSPIGSSAEAFVKVVRRIVKI